MKEKVKLEIANSFISEMIVRKKWNKQKTWDELLRVECLLSLSVLGKEEKCKFPVGNKLNGY